MKLQAKRSLTNLLFLMLGLRALGCLGGPIFSWAEELPAETHEARPETQLGTSTQDVRRVTYAEEYASIQEAINAAPPGGVVELSARIYEESRGLRIAKPLTLRGPNRGDAQGAGALIRIYDRSAAIQVTSPNVLLENFSVVGKTEGDRLPPVTIAGNGAHQLVIRNLVAGGASEAEVDIDNYFNVSLEHLVLNARSPGTGIGIRSRGTLAASTTLRLFAVELNDYVTGVELNNTYGTQIYSPILVGISSGIRFVSGGAHVLVGGWFENDKPGMTAVEIAGPTAKNVLIQGVHRSGRNPPKLVSFSGGALPWQILILNAEDGKVSADFKSSLSVPEGEKICLDGPACTRFLRYNSRTRAIEIIGAPVHMEKPSVAAPQKSSPTTVPHQGTSTRDIEPLGSAATPVARNSPFRTKPTHRPARFLPTSRSAPRCEFRESNTSRERGWWPALSTGIARNENPASFFLLRFLTRWRTIFGLPPNWRQRARRD
jgi:hypothetical protein